MALRREGSLNGADNEKSTQKPRPRREREREREREIHVRTRTRTHARTHTHTRARASTHARTHAHTHAQVCMQKEQRENILAGNQRERERKATDKHTNIHRESIERSWV